MQVTLTLDPEKDSFTEVQDVLAAIFDKPTEDVEFEAEEDDETPPTHGPRGWTQSRMNQYVDLLTPKGRTALAYIVDNGGTVSIEDLRDHLGVDGGRSFVRAPVIAERGTDPADRCWRSRRPTPRVRFCPAAAPLAGRRGRRATAPSAPR